MLIDLGELFAEAFAQPLADGWGEVIRKFKPDADGVRSGRAATVFSAITLLCLITGFVLLDNGLKIAGIIFTAAAGVITAVMAALIVFGKKMSAKIRCGASHSKEK